MIENLASHENIYKFYEKYYQDNILELKSKDNFLEIIGKIFMKYIKSL